MSITSIVHPAEVAFRLMYGDEAYDYLTEVGTDMGYDYWEILSLGQSIYEGGFQFPAGNDNKIPRRKPPYKPRRDYNE